MNIPKGWKLVPVEPTPVMTTAYAVAADELTKRHLLSGSYPATWQPIEAGYAAMIAAAPIPPAQDDYSPRMKREDDCMTLQDWRIRAMNLEASWANCSRACARMQTQRDEALEVLRELVTLKEMKSRFSYMHAIDGGADPDDYYRRKPVAWERARALLTKRGAA